MTWWSGDDVRHGSFLRIGCDPGHLFIDGTDRTYSTCDEPDWTHPVPICQGEADYSEKIAIWRHQIIYYVLSYSTS